jgi:hypothetical protein
MCLIIHSDKTGFSSFTRRELTGILRANSDGFGLVWDTGDSVEVIREEAPTYKQVRSYFTELGRVSGFAHFRFSTNSVGGLDGVHPFPVFPETSPYQLHVMHNGVFHGAPKGSHDTLHWLDTVLRPVLRRDPYLWRLSAFQNMLEKATTGQRLALMDSDGRWARLGEWYEFDRGLFVSNLYAWGDYANSRAWDWDAEA